MWGMSTSDETHPEGPQGALPGDRLSPAADAIRSRRARLAALALAVGLPSVPGAAAIALPPAPAPAPAPVAAAPPETTPACLAATLCALQDEVRWRTPAWSPSTCRRTADAVLSAARKYDLSPALIVAVMLNESDLDEKASIPYYRDGELYAKDGGLMGVRCVFQGSPHPALSQGERVKDTERSPRCDNGHVQGLSFRAIMDPVKNVELGAKALAYFRDKGGVEKKVVRERNAQGKLVKRTKNVRCKHRDHAWWAHYNHGSFYIKKGYARHYPHRVAVLYSRLSRVLGVPAPELTSGRITMRDPGRRARTIDRPVESRYRVLYDKIGRVGGACEPPVTAAR
jgi:soluble lytic murein transglycosylase-like protein